MSSPVTPDDEVLKAFKEADFIDFSARRFNSIRHRKVKIEGIDEWVPLPQILSVLKITPQDLRPVFNPLLKVVKKKTPFWFCWFGFKTPQYKLEEIELPLVIKKFAEFETFPLHEEPFKALAKLLCKTIVVHREDGASGEHYPCFTVTPEGHIAKH